MVAALRIFLRGRSCIRPALLTLMLFGIVLLRAGTASADPLAQWQWKNPLPQGNAIRSVALGPNGFVAVGDMGTIVTSTDGTLWNSHKPTGNTSDLKAVSYGKKVFIAVGAAGTILSSSDGSIWNDISANFKPASGAATRPNLNAITYGNNQFYAVGDGGTLICSTDGVSWTNNSSASGLTSQNLNGIVYSNYTFVAVGANGTVLALMNQGVWQSVNSGTPNALNAVASNRSLFVAVGAAGTILSSPDGINWTPQASGTGNALFGVNFGVSNFVAAGANGTLITWDGIDPWSAVDPLNIGPAPVGISNALYGVVYGGNLFAVVGSAGAIVTAPEPAALWTKRLAGPVAGLKSIAFGNSAFIAVGSQGALLYSADGTSWVGENSPTNQDLNCVIYDDNQFVAVGSGGVILNSFDGLNWSTHFSGTGNFNSVVFDSRPAYSRFVAVGDAGAVLSSPDGASWTPVFPAPTGNNLKGVALGDNLLVAVGQGGTVLTSPDGVTWTPHTGITKDLNGVTVAFKPSGATDYVAVGALGTIYYSTDAVKWTAAKTLPAAYKSTNFNAIACDFDSSFSTFLVAGDGGAILASADGQTWTDKLRVTGGNLAGVSYINRSYWVVSVNGIILNSNRLDNYIAVSASRKDSGAPVSSEVLDFGFVDLGATSFAITLKITNTGQTTNLNVSSLALSGPDAGDFTLATSSCGATPVIAPGGSCTVDLSLQPGSASALAKSAVLTILSDDSAQPVYPVPLTGYGGLFLQIQPGPNGSILSQNSSGPAVSGLFPVTVGATPPFFMSPQPGYYTQEVLVDGVSLGPLPSYSFAPIVASNIPRTLQAYFSNAPLTITASASAGGGLLPGVGQIAVVHGGTQPFAIQPSLGYHLASLLVDGAAVQLTSLYSFPKLSANHTLQANFAVNNYSVGASAETNGVADSTGIGGSLLVSSVTPVGGCNLTGNSGTCSFNSSLSYSIIPKPGYRLTNVLVDNASLGSATSSYSFASISDSHTIKATFSNQFDITVSYGGFLAVAGASVPNGAVSPAPNPLTGTVSAANGQSKSFSIAANDGYDIQDVKADGASLGPVTSYTFVNVQTPHTLDVSFVAKSYALNLSAAPNGSFQAPDGSVFPPQVAIPYHGTKVIRIVPDPEYEVADVLVDGVSVSAVTSYVFTDVVKGHSIEARFRGKPRVLVLSCTGPATPIAGLSFSLALPASATLPLNPDPSAPLGEVDPAALSILSSAAGSKFDISLPPAIGVAPGTARVVLVSGPGFSPGGDFLKIAYTDTITPAGSFTPNPPDIATDTAGKNIVGAVAISAVSSAVPASHANYPGGLYSAPFNVALSSLPVGAEIHYRTDGLDPTDLSTIYKSDNSVPIAISAASTTLKYYGLDRASGNREPIRTEIYLIDKSAPTALISGVPPALTQLNKATLQVSGRDVVSYKYLLDSTAKLSAASSAPETPVAVPIQLGVPIQLADGAHKLQVIGRDSAGNWQSTPSTAQWSVDTTLPASTISPAGGVYYAPISVRLANAKATAKLYYTLGGQAVSYQDALGNTHPTPEALPYSAPIPVTASTTVNYFALDSAGNAEAQITTNYTLLMLGVDAPLSPTDIGSASPVLLGSVSPGTLAASGAASVSVAIARGINPPSTGQATVAGNRWSYDISQDPAGALQPGLNTITVTATDNSLPPNKVSQTVYVRVAVLPCVTPDGDIDRDGQVTMADASLAMQMAIGLVPQDPTMCGDVWPVDPVTKLPTRDGSIGVNDALFILQKVMGIPSFLP